VQLVVVWVVPAVAATWKAYEPAGVFPDFEVDEEELPPQPNGSKVRAASAVIIKQARRRLGQSSSRPPAKIPQLNVVMPGARVGLTVRALLTPDVETVSVDDWAVPPARFNVAGLKAQEAFEGNPVHVKVTLPA
jgi:hypothetical protein